VFWWAKAQEPVFLWAKAQELEILYLAQEPVLWWAQDCKGAMYLDHQLQNMGLLLAWGTLSVL